MNENDEFDVINKIAHLVNDSVWYVEWLVHFDDTPNNVRFYYKRKDMDHRWFFTDNFKESVKYYNNAFEMLEAAAKNHPFIAKKLAKP